MKNYIKHSTFYLIIWAFLFTRSESKQELDYDWNLYSDLMENYSPFTLPQSDDLPSRPSIKIQLEIYGVRQIDFMESTVAFKCAFRQWWNDTRLMWNPADYGGIRYIWLPPPQIWVSDMSVRQDAGQQEFTDLKKTNVRVRYDGQHYYSMFGDVKVISHFELADFPYDQQTIDMTFGSWLYVDDRVHIELYDPAFIVQSNANTTWRIDNIEWEFTNYNVTTIFQKAASGNYYRYNFQVQLQRIGGTILIAVLIPGSMISFLGCLYILLPRGDKGERVVYLSTVLLTEIMFLVMITSFVPLSKQIPVIGWLFLSYTILLSALTIAVLGMEKLQDSFIEERKHEQRKVIKDKRDILSEKAGVKLSKQQSNIQMGMATQKRNFNSEKDFIDYKAVDNQINKSQIDEIEAQYKEEIFQLRKKMKDALRLVNLIDLGVFGIGMLSFIVITAFFLSQALKF